MYAADVKGQRLNFAVSGMLWKRSLVMRDEETGSLWSHILGKGMDGQLKGMELEVIPSLLTDWGSWKKLHPQSTAIVFSKTSENYNHSAYDGGRFQPDKFVVGIASGKFSRAWRYDLLKAKQVLNDDWRDRPVVVSLEVPSYSSTIFSRKLDDQVLTFALQDSKIVDEQTTSTWNLQSGKAIDGPLKGKELRRLRSIPSFITAWRNFHPDSTYWSPNAESR